MKWLLKTSVSSPPSRRGPHHSPEAALLTLSTRGCAQAIGCDPKKAVSGLLRRLRKSSG